MCAADTMTGLDTGLAQQAAPHIELRRKFHAPEIAAVDSRNPVMLGQPFVQERVFRIQQIDQAAIFMHHASDKQLRFLAHGEAQIVVKIGKDRNRRRPVLQGSQIQPLTGEVDHQPVGP